MRTSYERSHAERRLGMKRGRGAVGRQKEIKRPGCQMAHLKWKHLRTKDDYIKLMYAVGSFYSVLSLVIWI
jgi:hypothetical protein